MPHRVPKEISEHDKKMGEAVTTTPIVLKLADEHPIDGLEQKELEALAQMEDYYNDVLED